MAQYAHQQVTIGGAAVTPVTPTTSDTVRPDDRVILEYENTGTQKTITILTPAGMDFGTAVMPPLTYTLPATTGRMRIGPLSSILADPTTGLITVNIDVTTGVTVAAVRI